MKNILLSELIESENCFNCDKLHLKCRCEYSSYHVKNIYVCFKKFSNIILIRKQSKNEYIISFEKNDFVIHNITLQELFEKIETCIVFQ